jgi:predicted transcriptional regulator
MDKKIENEINSVRVMLEQLLALYKLVHLDQVKKAKKKVLVSKSRLEVYKLCDGKKGVTEISKLLGVSQPTVTHHLTELSELGLVSNETRKGKKYYFKVI